MNNELFFLQIIARAIAIIDCLSHLHPPLSVMVQHWLGLARLLGVGWTVSFEQIPATAALKSGNTCHLEAVRKWRKSHQDLFHAHILDRITIHLSSLVDHPVNLDLSCQLVAWANRRWNRRWQDANWCADSLVQGTSGGVLFGDLGGSESSQEVFGSIPFKFKSLTTGPQSKLKRVENLELKWLNGEAQLGPWSFVPKKLQPILLLVNYYSIPHPV